MAERLTRNNKVNYYFHDEASNIVYYKLQKLEDIMVKYGIESVEELSNALEFATVIEKTLSDYVIQNNEELEELLDDNKYAQNVVVKLLVELQNAKIDRDTWERACELACKRICYMLDQEMQYHEHKKFNSEEYLKTETDYFYQQAKTEGNDERN